MSPLDLPRPFLRRVRIRNYKSIGRCDVRLWPLTILVGRNGAGKSNFLDAISFVTDGLASSLDHAIKSRGGIDDVRRRSTGHPRNFAVELEIALADWSLATYGFEVTARRQGGFAVKGERLEVVSATGEALAGFRRRWDRITAARPNGGPPAVSDRLYLVSAAGLPDFRPPFDALVSMGFYNLSPEAMAELQSPDAGQLMRSDGSNIASVVARLASDHPAVLTRIASHLAAIVPGITHVERVSLGPRETLQFGQRVEGSSHPWRFFANSMSDGTLRALGALVAVHQRSDRRPVRLVGIEEPETALHPAAASSLVAALREAMLHTQVLATSHSPALLDQIDPADDGILAVAARDGTSSLAGVDPAALADIRRHLSTPGELLRLDRLQPDDEELRRQRQMNLF